MNNELETINQKIKEILNKMKEPNLHPKMQEKLIEDLKKIIKEIRKLLKEKTKIWVRVSLDYNQKGIKRTMIREGELKNIYLLHNEIIRVKIINVDRPKIQEKIGNYNQIELFFKE